MNIDQFSRLITVLGFLALLIFGLYLGNALLGTLWEIWRNFWWWLRRDFLPGAVWFSIFGAAAWVIWGMCTRKGIFKG
ncbi:MAG: hypothetical protein AAGC93_29380 [Cyanobacteria bacterium P01_F01_bin.53]